MNCMRVISARDFRMFSSLIRILSFGLIAGLTIPATAVHADSLILTPKPNALDIQEFQNALKTIRGLKGVLSATPVFDAAEQLSLKKLGRKTLSQSIRAETDDATSL